MLFPKWINRHWNSYLVSSQTWHFTAYCALENFSYSCSSRCSSRMFKPFTNTYTLDSLDFSSKNVAYTIWRVCQKRSIKKPNWVLPKKQKFTQKKKVGNYIPTLKEVSWNKLVNQWQSKHPHDSVSECRRLENEYWEQKKPSPKTVKL